MITINIDAAFIAAFFAGLAGMIGAVVAGYLKIREAQRKAVVKVEEVHQLVNSRDTAQRKLIQKLYDRLDGMPYEIRNGGGTKTVRKKPAPKRKPTTRRKR